MFIIVIVISLEHCTMHSRYWFIQVQVQVLYSMHSRNYRVNFPQFRMFS